MPEVSVLMSVYNGQTYLPEAIESILKQTFTDFEFIIVDDGSTDDTPKILARYNDPRIVRLHHKPNIGLTRSLNRGLEAAQGHYIARIDADDIAVLNRLEKQVTYLKLHPEIGLVSGNVHLIDKQGRLLNKGMPLYDRPAKHNVLIWHLLWANPIPHMTVMMRKSVLEANKLTYDPDYNTAEDHDLWIRLAHHTQLSRLSELEAKHRIISTSVSHSRRKEQLATQYRIIKRELKMLFAQEIPDSALKTIFEMLYHDTNQAQDFRGASQLIVKVYRYFLAKSLLPDELQTIKGETISYLLKLSRRGQRYSREGGSAPLWALWQISQREFFSRNTGQHLRKAIFRW